MKSFGINETQSGKLVEELNQLLADYMMFYQNSRGLHWNIRGDKFFELHIKFEELYTNLLLKVDEIAERILTLGGTPLHTFTDYGSCSKIKPVKNVSKADQAVLEILNAFSVILPAQRHLLALSTEATDEGTNALMSDYIREQEKLVWMYSAYQNV
jgi:starvation-inducible DNA-binding protein